MRRQWWQQMEEVGTLTDLPMKSQVVAYELNNYLRNDAIIRCDSGSPEYGVDLEPIDHVKFAEAYGATGFRIVDPAECGSMMERALATPGPVIIEAVVDANEPPMPPKIARDQVREIGEPRRAKP